jgi:ribosomal protein L11 methyltransferase
MLAWRRLVFQVPRSRWDDVVVGLHERGTLGVEEIDGRLHAYFPEGIDGASVARGLAADLGAAAGEVTLEQDESVPDGRWHERWLEKLAPFPIGRGFLVAPSLATPRLAAQAEDGPRRILRLPPGRAFGTGDHPTTRMCLELLEEEIRAGDAALDVGTGSGILAIAARLLGADPVAAIDIDPIAVEVARRNADLNGVAGILFAAGGLSSLLPRPHDLVAANLTGATLLRSMGSLRSLAGRRLILSGILADEEREVAEAARREGLRVLASRSGGDWTALLLGGAPDG